jgi:hypothetical protein
MVKRLLSLKCDSVLGHHAGLCKVVRCIEEAGDDVHIGIEMELKLALL